MEENYTYTIEPLALDEIFTAATWNAITTIMDKLPITREEQELAIWINE